MNKHFRRCAAGLAAAVMALSAGAVSVSAEEEAKKIVVLGDSISTGAQVRRVDGEFVTTYLDKTYVDFVSEALGAEVTNFAVDGYTTADLLASLETAEVQQALEEADIILVSIGLHDMMDDFMDTAWGFMDEFGFAQFADVFSAQLADYGLTETDLQNYCADLTYAVKSHRAAAAANMLEIGEKLSVYSDAQVVYQNVYNCIDTIENIDELSAKRRDAYNMVCNIVTNNLNDETSGSVNDSLNQIASSYGCDVIDVFTGFKGYAYRYVNLDELDMNPTAEGQAWIADAVLAAVVELDTGDVNGDGTVDAADAAVVLKHAANIGTGGSGIFTSNQVTAGDVNRDSVVDATDASRILIYAAQIGSGGTPSWN